MTYAAAYITLLLGWIARSYYEEWRAKRAERSVWRENLARLEQMQQRVMQQGPLFMLDDLQDIAAPYRAALPPKEVQKRSRLRRVK